jgi:hypothetical protein
MQRLVNRRPSKDSIYGDFGGEGNPLTPSYTANGPSSPFVVPVPPTAVPGVTIITAPFAASQKAIISYSVEVDTSTVGTQQDVTISIFDGTPGTPIDTYHQTIGNSTVETNSRATISWTLEVPGTGGARTFGVAVSTPGGLVVPVNGARGVVAIVNG